MKSNILNERSFRYEDAYDILSDMSKSLIADVYSYILRENPAACGGEVQSVPDFEENAKSEEDDFEFF